MKRTAILLLLINILISCGVSNKQEETFIHNNIYSSFIQNLKENEVKLKKYIVKDGISDSLNIDSVDWKKELKFFLKSDISNKNLKNYKILKESDCSTTYLAKDKKQSIIKFSHSNCDSLFFNIDILNESGLYKFEYHLELNKNGFLIENKQDVRLGITSNYRIEGKFI